jgi:hypothetical protein
MKPCQRGVLGRGREVGAEGDRGETPKLTGVRLPDGSTGGASSFVSGSLAADFVRVFEGERMRDGGGYYRRVCVAEGARDRIESRRFRGDRIRDRNELVRILWEG